MARIPEGELERLKAEVSLERLAESQGIRLAVHGADRIGLCPFHDDTEPSLPSDIRHDCSNRPFSAIMHVYETGVRSSRLRGSTNERVRRGRLAGRIAAR